MKNYYDVLRIKRNSSFKEIRTAFLNLSKIYHPDKNKSLDAQAKFVKINEAYSVLGKAETRRQYDNILINNLKTDVNNLKKRQVEYYDTERYNYHDPRQYYYHVYGQNHQQNVKHNRVIKPDFVRKLFFIYCCSCILLAVGSAFYAGYVQRKAKHRSQVLHLMAEKWKKQITLLGTEKLMEMKRAGTLKGFSYREIEKELLEKQKKE
ncbi:hypothetical protein RUM43_008054 [Polyplax serrata]|uniref:J domain-containing protein n=1 Tax=Polyplax serrata TaxID=468196 RepID=A0AAN8P6T3_POLSC